MNKFVTTVKVFLLLAFLAGWSQSANAQTYKRHALIEEGTGTWCGWCPYGAYTIDSMERIMGEKMVAIAWHGPSGNSEPMKMKATDTVAMASSATGYPWSFIGRSTGLVGGPTSFPNQWSVAANQQARQAPKVDFRIVNATYNPATRAVDFDIDITPFDYSALPKEDTSEYATVAVLTEDGITADQSRFASGNLEGGIISDFVHYNVARKVAGKVMGDKITMGTATPSATVLPIRRHYKMVVDQAWNADKIEAKSFVVHRGKGDQVAGAKRYQNYLDAGQTSYVTNLPETVVPAAWVVLPRAVDPVAAGKTTNVVWATGGTTTAPVKIEYQVVGTSTWNPVVASTTQSPYAWSVPVDASGKTVKLKVTSVSNPTAIGLSEDLTVTAAPTITFVNPTAGEVIPAKSTYNVKFTTTGNVEAKRTLELSINGGITWTKIMDVTGTEAVWEVPNTPSEQAQLKLSTAGGITAVSPTFVIGAFVPGTINNVTIEGSPKLKNDQSVVVSWAVNGAIGTSVQVHYSADNKATWTPITTVPLGVSATNWIWNTPASGYYPVVYVRVMSDENIVAYSEPVEIGTNPVSVRTGNTATEFSVINNPNPFNPSTTITYSIAERGPVTLKVSDLLGREIATLVNEPQSEGIYTQTFDAKGLESGTYVATLTAGGKSYQTKMTLSK